jgi:hypothetical protein
MLKTVKYSLKTSLLEWWQLISNKRCDSYAHLLKDYYNEAMNTFLQKR